MCYRDWIVANPDGERIAFEAHWNTVKADVKQRKVRVLLPVLITHASHIPLHVPHLQHYEQLARAEVSILQHVYLSSY